MRTNELKPCPFCGGDDVEFVPLYNNDCDKVGGKIRCNCCLSTFVHPEANDDDELVEYWNRRPEDAGD